HQTLSGPAPAWHRRPSISGWERGMGKRIRGLLFGGKDGISLIFMPCVIKGRPLSKSSGAPTPSSALLNPQMCKNMKGPSAKDVENAASANNLGSADALVGIEGCADGGVGAPGKGVPGEWYSRGYLPHRDRLHLLQSV